MAALAWTTEKKKASFRHSGYHSILLTLIIDVFVEREDYEDPSLKEGTEAFRRFDK
jgi:hypothetical protein